LSTRKVIGYNGPVFNEGTIADKIIQLAKAGLDKKQIIKRLKCSEGHVTRTLSIYRGVKRSREIDDIHRMCCEMLVLLRSLVRVPHSEIEQRAFAIRRELEMFDDYDRVREITTKCGPPKHQSESPFDSLLGIEDSLAPKAKTEDQGT
jgi:hypothetical protein